MPELMSKNTFADAYRKYMEEGGHSYDPYDVIAAWHSYKKNPNDYNFLFE